MFLVGTLFLGRSPLTSPGSSFVILYLNAPHTGMHPNSRTHHRGTGYSHWDMLVSSLPPNLEGKQVILLRMLWQATRYP
jgi:hypothetical protein